ncbi:MAG: hypothetical protein E7403_03240 [Ruminococcaceae bacterium]|nr:hypothetical protein [Oscillospiraceae bacterium]
MSIPRRLIRKMAGENDIYSEGLSLSNTSFSFEITPTSFFGLFHISAEFPEDSARVHLEIDNENEWFEVLKCNCGSATENGSVCKHIVALLLKIENEFFSENFGRYATENVAEMTTDEQCLSLLKNRISVLQLRAKQRASFEKAMVTPVISFAEDGVRFMLKIGCGRAYIVRDLQELFNRLTNREIAPCGRSESFLFAPENFNKEPLIRFFMAYYPICKTEHGKYMILTPEALDYFLEICQEDKILTEGSMITLREDIPAFTLSIKASNNFYRLSLNNRDFDVIDGKKQVYLKAEDVLYICGEDFSDACGSLLKRFSHAVKDPVIRASDMTTFYNLILKPTAKYIHMECNDKSFIPAPLKTHIYLDIVGKKVVAKTEFHYDEAVYYAFSANRDLQTVWDIEGETLVENLIKTYFKEPGKEEGTAYFVADDEHLFSLVYEGLPELSRHAVLYIGADLKNIRVKPFPSTGVSVRAKSGLLQLDIASADLSSKTISEALTAYRQKKKYIRLKNGAFLLLETESMKQFDRFADGAGFSSSDIKKQELFLPAYRALYIDSERDIKIVKEKSFTRLMESFSLDKFDEATIPSSLKSVLRDYQKFGFRWMNSISQNGFGGILADDMGLGKTLQLLTLLTYYKETNGSCRSLVICPSSLILNWEQEIKKFTPSLSSLCVMGTSLERSSLLENAEKHDIIITSYDLLKRDINLYMGKNFDFEIIDEAQYIKNHNTQNARSVKAICAKHRFALTGTPIENGISELWSIFDYLMPGYLYRYSRFRERFEVPLVRDGDSSVLKELKKMTSPFILRRIKRDVLKELPEKAETVLYTALSPEQNKLYYSNLAAMHDELFVKSETEFTQQNRIAVLAMLMRLRQLCCDPGLIYSNYKENSAKFELCMNLVETSVASGHKILIFSQFTSMLEILGKKLKQKEIPYYLIEGATKKEDRIAQVDAFNRDDTPVFLISLKAGGTGLNLTGADTVIHYDPWWNVSAQNQATDRAHRIGQKNSVTVYKLIAKGTIEEKIMALADKKLNITNQVLPDENTLLSKLSKEEILELFR